MTKATFIFSLDCEGKWGMADRLAGSPYEKITNRQLETAYARLVELFDRYEVPATFAFVSGFFLKPQEVRDNLQWFEPLIHDGRDWFDAVWRDFHAGAHDGWLCPKALETVRRSGAHEIASHGFSHVPLGEADIGEPVFRREMASIRAA